GLYRPMTSTTTSRCSARSRSRSSADGWRVKSDTGGRASRTASTAARMPRSPSDRTIHPTLRAGSSSSEVSIMSTPPLRTSGSKGNRPAVRIHSMTSMQPPQAWPVTNRGGPCQLHGWVGSRSPKELKARVTPLHPDILRLAGVGDLQGLTGEEGGSQRPRMDVVDAGPGAKMHLRRAAVKARDPVGPQPVVQVGVVAHAQERLGITPGRLGVQVGDDGDLVLPANHRQDGTDRRIGECGVDVGGAG